MRKINKERAKESKEGPKEIHPPRKTPDNLENFKSSDYAPSAEHNEAKISFLPTEQPAIFCTKHSS
jgi:hypothetical protein